MITKYQLRTIIYYEWLQKKSSCSAATNINKILGEHSVSRTTVHVWFTRFDSGEICFEDDERSGRPTELNDNELRSCLEANPEVTTRELEETFGCSHVTILNHLHNLGYRKVLAKWIPHQLTDYQKQVRLTICESLLFQPHRKDFLESLVTGDESWVLYNNVKRRAFWLPRDVKLPTQAQPEPHQRKNLLCVWFDSLGCLYFELMPVNATVNASVYSNQLQKLADIMKEKRSRRATVHLLHDNARPHTALLTRQKICELGWHPVPHPPYSPDIAPCDYYLFRPLKHFLSGQTFNSYDALKMAINSFFESQLPAFWRDGIQMLPDRWAKVIDLNGDYIVE